MVLGEVVLGAVLQVLFDRLASPKLLEYFACREGLQEWMDDWKDKLSRVQAVLKDANEKQYTNGEVKLWLDKFTDLAYDVEDILDELAVEANLQGKLIGEKQASTSKVRNLRVLACFNGFTSPSVVEFNSSTMRKKMEKISARFDDLMTQKDELNLNRNVDGTVNTITKKTPSTSLVRTTNHIMYGREEDAEAVRNLLLKNDAVTELNVISILGMGGIGKTRLAQFVYDDQEVKSFFKLKAWVCVSKDFDVEAITKTILLSVVDPQINCNNMDLNLLQLKLKDAICGKSFLIVLDDVWNRDHSEWTLLCAPFEAMAPGSSIIITSRDQQVSSRMTAVKVRPYRLGSLSNDACLSIFAQHALHSSEFSAHPKHKEISEKIVRKCKGLPLAVKAVGSLLHNKEAESNKWELISNSKIWDTLEQSGDVPALMLTYHHLPSHLKRCFAYCAIFPKGYEFEKNQVVLLWMAEGLIQCKENIEMEVLGKEYFDDLISWSLFEESYKDKSKFLMHDLINDLAQLVAGNTCVRMKDRVESSTEQGNTFIKARHLSYLGGKYDGIEKLDVFLRHTCLRTFLPLMLPCPGNCYLAPHVPLQLITRLRCLRVFCLRGYRITELSDSISNLKLLRHLDLSETLIRSMPDSITTLYNLQTLLLENCFHLNKLPSTLGNLVNLRHLNIQGAIHLEGMPMQLGKLTRLRSLSNMVVGKDSTCSGIKELGSLPHLRETLCISGLENVTEPKEAKDATLSNKPGVTGLSLEWSDDIDESKDRASEYLEVLENLEPHESLKELTIRCYGGRDFPTWLRRTPSFLNMEILKIENCGKCTSLPAIGQLSFLKFLSIGGMANVKDVGPEFCGNDFSQPFRSLETLHFHDMKEWENWSPCEEFPNLRELSLRRCPKINGNLPNQLPSLKKVKIYGCGQLRISVPNIPGAYEIEVAGSKGVVHRSTVDFSSLQIRSLSKISMFTSEIVGFDKQWMTHAKDLTISTCEVESTHLWSDDCESLPDFPCLDLLCIESCPKLVSLVVGRKEELLQQDMPCPPTQIEIKNCIALKSLPESLMYNNTRLKLIRIVKCDLLKHIARRQLPPTLERIEVSECKELEYLLDDDTSSCNNTTSHLQYLKIQRCPSLKSLTSSGELPASLKHLYLLKCAQLKSIAERLHHNSCLECIVIVCCENLEYLPRDIHTLSTLREIDTTDCPSLSFSLSEEWLPANLRVLQISGCKKMALPKGIHNHTSLQSLTLHRRPDDPDDVSFPEEGFPTNLKLLSISHLKIIDALLDWGLNKLTSLNYLEISGCPHLVSFPDQMKLPKSLTSLTISDFPNLRNLSCAGLQNLTSLNELIIAECGKFTSFPKDGLPPSLSKLCITKCEKLLSFPKKRLPASLLQLHIYQCPLLEKHCEKDGGEESWKISHVPCVRFNTYH